MLTNAWIIHDTYSQDITAQQQKIQQQQAQENSKSGGGAASSSTASAGPAESASSPATFLLPPTGETVLSNAAVARLDQSAHVIERMLNQNTYDEIAQGKS